MIPTGVMSDPKELQPLSRVADEEGFGAIDDVMRPEGTTSTTMTVLGMTKASIGMGFLAVPHALATGGVSGMVAMLIGLAVWNEWSGYRLLECRRLLTASEHVGLVRSGRGPLASLAFVAGGPASATIVDTMFVFLVVGVVTSYMVACHDTISNVISWDYDAFIFAALCFPITLVRDIGRLAGVGAVGLCCIAASFTVVIATTEPAQQRVLWTVSTNPTDLAQGFGVLAYCYGIVPLVPQYEASMMRPRHFRAAQVAAYAVTTTVYAVVGVAVVALANGDCSGNILDDLPANATATAVRLAMAAVCVVSAPIGVVAAAEILQSRLGCSALGVRLALRATLLLTGATLAVALPSFALIVSVVGAGTITFLSFVLPPAIHARLARRRWRTAGLLKDARRTLAAAEEEAPLTRSDVLLDDAAAAFGLGICLLATALTGNAVAAQLRGQYS